MGFATIACLVACSDEAKHWNAFEQCMLGEPLQEGQNVFLKLRGVQLAEAQKPAHAEPWPARCGGYAKALHDELGDSGTPGMVKRSLSEQLGGCEPQCTFPKQGPVLPKADELWSRAKNAGWESELASDVPKPAAPLTLPAALDYPELAEGYKLVDSQLRGDELWLAYRKGATAYRACRLAGATATCKDGKSLPQLDTERPLSLVHGAERPTLAGWQGGKRRAYDLETGKEVPAFGEEFHEVHDGVGFVQQEQEVADPTQSALAPKFTVQYLKDGKPLASGELEVSARVRGPHVVGDWLVYVERNDDLEPRFGARKLSPSGNVVGSEATELGGKWPGPMQVCSAGESAAVAGYVPPIRRIQKDPKPGMTPITVALLHEGKWLEPVDAELPKQVAEFGALSCGEGWAAVPWVDITPQQLAVRALRCTPGGCERREALIEEPGVQHVSGVALFGPQAIVVYRSPNGETLMRAGRLEQLSAAKPAPLFDAEVFGGLPVNAPSLLPAKDHAYFFPDKDSSRVLRLGTDGSAKPVAVK